MTIAEPSSVTAPGTSPGAVDEGVSSRRFLVFGIVAVALMMASIDQTIVATALSVIQKDLDTDINWSGWTITVYALGQIVVKPLAGWLSDRFGAQQVFVTAAVVFTVSSLACSLAGTIYVLIVCRAVQAIGGGAFVPCATSIIAAHFGPGRDRAIGLFASIFPIGGILGPVVGGVLLTFGSWRTIFLVNVPMGVLLVVLGLRCIPRSPRRRNGRPDLLGAGMFGTSILLLMLGVTFLGDTDSSLADPFVVVPVVAGLVLGWLFFRHARRVARPFVEVRLLTGRGFGLVNLINLLYGGAALGFGALVPLYAQERYGIAPLHAGVLLTARAVGMILVAGLAVLALRRTGYRGPMIVGLLIIAAGMASMAVEPVGTDPFTWLALGAAVTGIGMGLSVPASSNAGLQLDPGQVAAISGLRGMFKQAGGIVAISVSTAVLAHSEHPGLTQGHLFFVFVALLLLMTPFILRIPEHRGGW